MSGKLLAGKVCLVTGASRGIGKGIALQLAENGATVYITGRTLTASSGPLKGSLRETADEIAARGGKCIPVQCDHSKDEDVTKLFDQITREQNGKLDILVNNAFSMMKQLLTGNVPKLWEDPVSRWDSHNAVGLRNHYICTGLAAKLMIPRRQGLIVNVNSIAGLRFVFNSAYGVGKAGVDRMARDCAKELSEFNIAVVTIWPGPTASLHLTDMFQYIMSNPSNLLQVFAKKWLQMESIEYPGMCITRLSTDPDLMKKSGKCIPTFDLGEEYSLVDKKGYGPRNQRTADYMADVFQINMKDFTDEPIASDATLMAIGTKF